MNAGHSEDHATRHSESKTALFAALAGALIGGLFSFGGTFISIHSSQQSQRDEAIRQAFVDLFAKATQYNTDRSELAETPRSYAQIRRRLARQNGPMNAAIANVKLLTSGDAADRATDVQRALFSSVLPVDPARANRADIRKAVDEADIALKRFGEAARSELGTE